jgi:hypothetical protein
MRVYHHRLLINSIYTYKQCHGIELRRFSSYHLGLGGYFNVYLKNNLIKCPREIIPISFLLPRQNVLKFVRAKLKAQFVVETEK